MGMCSGGVQAEKSSAKCLPLMSGKALPHAGLGRHFSLWCMFDATLVATNDVRQHDVDIERILLNPETIAINQDDFDASSLAKLTTSRDGETWSRPLANGDIAVLVLNRKGVVMRTGFDWSSLPGVARGEAGVRFRVRDLQGFDWKDILDFYFKDLDFESVQNL